MSDHLLKKYSTRVLFTVTDSMSPNAITGATTSPRLNSSVRSVKVYVGLNALESSWRAILELAIMLASITGSTQYRIVCSNTVALKTWLLPKYASDRLLDISFSLDERTRKLVWNADAKIINCNLPKTGVMLKKVVLV